ncbi:DNA polymerase [Bienertia sinuspersici]
MLTSLVLKRTTMAICVAYAYAYPSIGTYAKFQILVSMKVSPGGIISFTIGKAIPLTFDDGKLIPQSHVYARILRAITTISERYDTCMVKGVTLRVFVEGRVENRSSLLLEERVKCILECQKKTSQLKDMEPISARDVKHQNRSYPTHTEKQYKSTEPFLVADTETILYKGEDLDPSSSLEASSVEVHSPFAAGVMIVRLGVPVKDSIIECYYSTDYTPIIYPTHKERSTRVLDDFLKRIISIIRQNPEIQTVYFYNFSRFDGIFLLKHLIVHNEKYEVKPLMRTIDLIRSFSIIKKNVIPLQRLIDLLLSSLNSLVKNLCPELGNKAQMLCWDVYKVDIEKWMTVASLALGIYQIKYFD